MKKIILLVLVTLFSIGASAQSANSIYKKYAGRPGVSAVYISPTMFNIMKKIPTVSLQDEELDMVNIITSFNGMYLLDFEENSNSSKEMVKEVENFLEKGKYELLIEVKEEGEDVHIYISKHKNIITDFVMLVQDGGKSTFISITGNLSEEALNKAVASAMAE